MEKLEPKKIVPDLEINAGGETEQQAIINRLMNGYPVLFILPKNYNLYLSTSGHKDIRKEVGIQYDDELAEGLIRLENKIISVHTRDKTSEEIKSAIIEAVNIFLKESDADLKGTI